MRPKVPYLPRRDESAAQRGDVEVSSSRSGRCLCGAITYEASGAPIAVASFDDPASLPPSMHIWHESRLPWLATADSLPRHPELRPRP